MRNFALIVIVLTLVFKGFTYASPTDHRTKQGSFSILVQTEPHEPVVGPNKVILTIRNAGTGSAMEGATVKVVPWMSMHGHGSPKETHVKEEGNGVYEVENVYYTMEGPWDLLISIQKGNVEDTASVIVDIKR